MVSLRHGGVPPLAPLLPVALAATCCAQCIALAPSQPRADPSPACHPPSWSPSRSTKQLLADILPFQPGAALQDTLSVLASREQVSSQAGPQVLLAPPWRLPWPLTPETPRRRRAALAVDTRAVPPSLPAGSPALMPGDVLWGTGWCCLEHPGLALREWVLEGLQAGESSK